MAEFQLAATTDLGDLAEQLTARFGLESERLGQDDAEPPAVERTYYDTFDGRLFRSGQVLVGDRQGTTTVLRLAGRQVPDESGPRQAGQRLDRAPRFVWDLPAGRLREDLTSLIDMRALLPQITTQSVVRRMAQRNETGKTVVRLALEHHQLHTGDGLTPLCARVRVEPLKGYGKALRRLVKSLERELQLERATHDVLSAALAHQNLQLDGYSSKIAVVLEPELRADAAVKRVLAEQCQTMLANLEGMCAEVDSEFLHDFRVSVRRTRSALARIRGVFPSPSVGRYRREFRWLGQLTGPARDYDVYLLDFAELSSELPQGLGQHLAPLRTLLEERRARAYGELRDAVRGRRGRRLLADWQKFVTSPVPKHSSLDNSCRPIGEVARGEIWRAYRRVLRQGSSIGDTGPGPELHELRKRCKALRYLLEFFRSLFPESEMSQLIAELKALQKILGSFQDLEVQSSAAARWGVELAERPDAVPETTLALGALAQQLASRQAPTLRRFRQAYERFSCKDNRKLARSLLRKSKPRNRP